jgi:hypothetical protein
MDGCPVERLAAIIAAEENQDVVVTHPRTCGPMLVFYPMHLHMQARAHLHYSDGLIAQGMGVIDTRIVFAQRSQRIVQLKQRATSTLFRVC